MGASIRDPGQWMHHIFQWDVRNWSRALPLWRKYLVHPAGSEALAIGERDGGLSLLLAQSGYAVHCTDLSRPSEQARALHHSYGLQDRVSYGTQDVTALTYADGRFDVVMFKSVIGALGTKDRQVMAIREMHRVLKPGGVLLFAENLAGTALHRWLRKRFVAWDRYWRYLRIPADADLFDGFSRSDIHTAGLFANLGRSEQQRNVLASIDGLCAPLVPPGWRYIVFGAAIKSSNH